MTEPTTETWVQPGPHRNLMCRRPAVGEAVAIVFGLVIQSIALAIELVAITPISYARFPNVISVLTFVLPSILGALTECLWLAIVLGPVPFLLVTVVYWKVLGQFPSISLLTFGLVLGMFVALSVLGWLVRQVLPVILPPRPDDAQGARPAADEQPASFRIFRMVREDWGGLAIAGLLISQTGGLLTFELVAGPSGLRLPFARQFNPLILVLTILLVVLTVLTPVFAVVLGALAHRCEAAILLAALPFWLLIAVYLALFAPSWYLDLQGVSNLAERILLTMVVFGLLGFVGWKLRRFLPRHVATAEARGVS